MLNLLPDEGVQDDQGDADCDEGGAGLVEAVYAVQFLDARLDDGKPIVV